MTAENQRGRMYSGDDQTIEITVTDADGNPVDLSNSELTFVISRYDTAEVTKTTGSGITVGGTDSNVATVQLDASDTEALSGEFDLELQQTDGAGNVATLTRGRLTIEADLIP